MRSIRDHEKNFKRASRTKFLIIKLRIQPLSETKHQLCLLILTGSSIQCIPIHVGVGMKYFFEGYLGIARSPLVLVSTPGSSARQVIHLHINLVLPRINLHKNYNSLKIGLDICQFYHLCIQKRNTHAYVHTCIRIRAVADIDNQPTQVSLEIRGTLA